MRKTLEQRLGPDGFHFTMGLSFFDPDEEDYDNDDGLEGEMVEAAAISAPGEPEGEPGDLQAA